MSFRIYYLYYEESEGRYRRQAYGLHCGDAVEAFVGGSWYHTRVEHSHLSLHSHGWFLPDFPAVALEDLPVRKEVAL